ncbi:MAG: PAS domain S-box protein, partial [Pedobacter sp.]|nr:PAS domain S-box protein [Chitinophagaceae bacterium]
RKNGSYFWSKIKGQPYKTTGKTDIQFFTIIEDITTEKEKEKQLKILSQIAETNINPVIITNEKGCITWINKSYIDISGYQQNEVIGKNLVNLLQEPNANQQTIDYIKKQILKGQPFSAEIYNHSKSGNKYWLRINGQPIYNTSGKLTGFFALEEDITKEKENQKRLKASELKFWIALEKIYENAWEHDFTTGKTSFSKSNNDFWGYTNNELTDNVDLWLESIYKDDVHLITDNYAKYLTKEIDSHNLEYRIVHKDGTVKWVMDRGVVIEKSVDGKPLRTIGTHTDITQTKLTETELDRRIKQFKSLSENIPGVIYEYEFREDGSEGLRYISPAIERVFGIKLNDFDNYLNYIHPDDRTRILQKNDYCKKTLTPFYDESILTVPGVGTKWHAVYSSFSYISQTGAKVFTGFMMDITERKNAEDILRTNEEKYRSIIANMKLGLMEVDNDSNIIYTNNSFCDMSGYSLKELLGNKATTLFTSAQNVALLDEKKEKRNKGIADAYQIDIIDKNKNIKWWLISSAPSYSDIGVQIGSIGIYLDITEQKKLELELIEARVQAEQLAKTKEVFLANMSHEIRTPMNAIIGMSNQLGKTSLEPQQKFYLDTVHSAADNLLVIINDILDLSKIEAGKLSLENVGFEPKTLLSKAIQVLAYRAEEKGLELINSHFDDGISDILIGDHYRLNQVLLNLISNALKFTEKGTIDLVFKLIKNDNTSQTIQVEVSDTGIGMEQSFVKQLFDKFSQEYKSISRRYGGTGLGMSICKQLIELMGGSITAKSKKGEGTTISFIIKFKKGTKKDLPKKETIQVSETFLTGKKILVVDDNDMNRLVASIILQNYGAEIIEAINGEQAIEKVTQQKCDVVLMDIHMPGINGFDATRIIRKINNNIPIIALTANAIKGESEKCIESGMNDYIPKPFKEEELLKTIAKWLGKKVSLIKNKSNNSIANNTQLYSLTKLTTISNGNNAFVQKMIQIFCDQTPLMLKEMMDGYNAKNWVKVGSTAHKMKPIIDNLDIYILKETIRNIEAVGEDTKEDKNLPKMLKEVTTVINKVIHIMRQEYKLPLNNVAIDNKF